MLDRNGTLLKVGDVVFLPARITNLSEGTEGYCNVTIESLEGRRPDDQKETCCINTGVLVLDKRSSD